MLDELRTLKDRSWHKTIVRSIASQNKLKVSIDKEIALHEAGWRGGGVMARHGIEGWV